MEVVCCLKFDYNCPESRKLKKYVNQPLRHFGELKLIIGDDFTNEEFKKSIFDKSGIIPFASIQVRNVPLFDIGEDGASAV